MTDVCKVAYQVTTGRYPQQELVHSAKSRDEANAWITAIQTKTPVRERNHYTVTPVHFAWVCEAWRRVNARPASEDPLAYADFSNSRFCK
jgi:hypothetical protein